MVLLIMEVVIQAAIMVVLPAHTSQVVISQEVVEVEDTTMQTSLRMIRKLSLLEGRLKIYQNQSE